MKKDELRLVTTADQLSGIVDGRTRGLAPVTVERMRALAAATVIGAGEGDAIGDADAIGDVDGDAMGDGDATTTGAEVRGVNWIAKNPATTRIAASAANEYMTRRDAGAGVTMPACTGVESQ